MSRGLERPKHDYLFLLLLPTNVELKRTLLWDWLNNGMKTLASVDVQRKVFPFHFSNFSTIAYTTIIRNIPNNRRELYNFSVAQQPEEIKCKSGNIISGMIVVAIVVDWGKLGKWKNSHFRRKKNVSEIRVRDNESSLHQSLFVVCGEKESKTNETIRLRVSLTHDDCILVFQIFVFLILIWF